ncbi:MAG: DUF5665 domain-containing protein [Halanaerobium sp.]|nr:DUF5665 domain-containing protein [Halanaerobium sp.]
MEPKKEIEYLRGIEDKVDKIAEGMNKFGIAEYIELLRQPRKMIFLNFIYGMARGLGIAVGATVLGAVLLAILFKMGELNLPIIGQFIARIVRIVQTYL